MKKLKDIVNLNTETLNIEELMKIKGAEDQVPESPKHCDSYSCESDSCMLISCWGQTCDSYACRTGMR